MNNNIFREILDLKKSGFSLRKITSIIGIPEMEVKIALRKIRKPNKWFWMSEGDKQFIRKHTSLSNNQIAKILNRNVSSIGKYRKSQFFLTDKEKQFVIDNRNLSSRKIAMVLNRHHSTICNLKKKLI